jgi:hypothetical protein
MYTFSKTLILLLKILIHVSKMLNQLFKNVSVCLEKYYIFYLLKLLNLLYVLKNIISIIF